MQIDAPNPKPRGRPRLFNRDAALDVAMRMFWSRGYQATSINDLEVALGISTPSLYAAFGDKKQLFRETIQRYCAGPGSFAGPALADKATAYEAIAALLLAAAHNYAQKTQPPGCMVIHAGVNCAENSDDIVKELVALRHGLQSTVAERITKGQTDGDVGAEIIARNAAAFFVAVIQGMSTQARDGANADLLVSIASQAMAAWRCAHVRSGSPTTDGT